MYFFVILQPHICTMPVAIPLSAISQYLAFGADLLANIAKRAKSPPQQPSNFTKITILSIKNVAPVVLVLDLSIW
jgi:hypothetical protein